MLKELLIVLRPVRGIPTWIRYVLTCLLVLLCFAIRYALDDPKVGYPYPFLLFVPAIIAAAFLFNRGSGFLATLLSALAALYFFVEPRSSFWVLHLGQALAILIFVAVGFLMAGLIESLRTALDEARRSEAALGASEARHRSTIDTAVDAIVTIDATGKMLSSNPAAERMFGYATRELIGKNVRILMPEEVASAHDGYVAAYRTTRIPQIIGIGREVEGRRKDGSVFPVELSVGEWTADGNTYFTGIMRDITARKRAEARLRDREERLRIIFESARDYAIFTLTPDGRVATWPPGAQATFGYTEEEIVGQDAAILFTPEDRHDGVPAQELEAARKDGQAPDRRWHLRKSGERFWVEGSSWLIRDQAGQERGFLKVGRDETARHAAEQLMASALEREALLTREVGHRIKNNLAIVASLLSLQARNTTNEEAQSILADARHRIDAIAQVHDQLWRQDQSETIDLDVFLRDLCSAVQKSVPHHQLTYRGDDPVAISVDRAVLISLITNELITNAVKYAYPREEGGPIDVRLRQCDDQNVCLTVCDSGGGFLPNSAEKSSTGGLGTKLLRTFARQLGAELRVDSTEAGTRAAITVPISAAGQRG